MASRIAARIAADTRPPDVVEDCARYFQHLLTKAAGTAVTRRVSALYPRRQSASFGERSPFSPHQAMPLTATLLRVSAAIGRFDQTVAERIRATEELFSCWPLAAKRSSRAQEVCYLAAPLFCSARDEVVDRLRRRGIATFYLYSPPMNRLYLDLADPDLDTGRIDTWSRMILPVAPRFAKEFLTVVEELSHVGGKEAWNESLSGSTTS
jgi:hypothetical protein